MLCEGKQGLWHIAPHGWTNPIWTHTNTHTTAHTPQHTHMHTVTCTSTHSWHIHMVMPNQISLIYLIWRWIFNPCGIEVVFLEHLSTGLSLSIHVHNAQWSCWPKSSWQNTTAGNCWISMQTFHPLALNELIQHSSYSQPSKCETATRNDLSTPQPTPPHYTHTYTHTHHTHSDQNCLRKAG